jgi:hypothetical protein
MGLGARSDWSVCAVVLASIALAGCHTPAVAPSAQPGSVATSGSTAVGSGGGSGNAWGAGNPFGAGTSGSGSNTGTTATSRQADLSWTAPTTNTNGTALTDLAGYIILYGTSPGSLTETVNLSNPGTTDYVVQNLTSGTWYFAIESYTNSGAVSSLSSVVSKTIT